MKRQIRLTESKLRRLIRESVKGMLNEIDWSSYPSSIDYRDKDAWWKGQVDADFPGHKVDQSTDWKTTYSDLALQKKKDDREQAKLNRQKERDERKAARQAARDERSRAKMDKRRLFEKTVEYVISGEAMLMSRDQIMQGFDDQFPEEEWYDGVMKMPIKFNPRFVRTKNQVWATIHGIGDSSVEVEDGYHMRGGWGIDINGAEQLGIDEEHSGAYIEFSVYLDPNRQRVNFVIDGCDNEIIAARPTAQLMTKYLNYLIPKKYKEVIAKQERYKQTEIVPESKLRSIVRESINKVKNR